MGEEVSRPPTTNNNIPYLFNPPSLLPSTSLNNLPPLQNPQIDGVDIDWVSLLNGSIFTNGDNQTTQQLPDVATTLTSGRNIMKESDQGENKARGIKASRVTKKIVPPRVAFHTRSSEDVLDDGYRWRKYGQKAVKNSVHPRSYYRCTHHTCNVKKQIQRLSKDTGVVVTTYEGIHNHPCEKLMETLGPLLKQIQFLYRL